ncbi:MAG: hypothetical protein Q8L27_00070 [archaeon]|nr:hypothetical protein [archaeon]
MNESLHIRIEYEEAIAVKKDILLSEQDLLETINYTRNYNILRKQELILKEKLKKELEALNTLVHEIEKNLPKESLHYDDEPSSQNLEAPIVKRTEKKIGDKKKTEVEKQIEDIRARLASLG